MGEISHVRITSRRASSLFPVSCEWRIPRNWTMTTAVDTPNSSRSWRDSSGFIRERNKATSSPPDSQVNPALHFRVVPEPGEKRQVLQLDSHTAPRIAITLRQDLRDLADRVRLLARVPCTSLRLKAGLLRIGCVRVKGILRVEMLTTAVVVHIGLACPSGFSWLGFVNAPAPRAHEDAQGQPEHHHTTPPDARGATSIDRIRLRQAMDAR